MPLLAPPQTSAKFGIMRFGGFRFGYVHPGANVGWTEVDPHVPVADWTRIGGEDDIIDEYDE